MMRKIAGLFPSLCLTLLLAACDRSASKIGFSIDNPADDPLAISIDGNAYTIEVQSAQDVALAPGKHSLQSPLTGPIDFVVYTGTDGGIINPTFSTYVQVQAVYATDDKAAKHFGPYTSTITLDGVEFSGSFRKREGLFIDKTWTFDVSQDFPEVITSYGPEKGRIPEKIFRKQTFVSYYESRSGEPGNYAKRHLPIEAAVAKYDAYPALPVFENAELEKSATATKALYQNYWNALDPAAQAKLRKDYFQVSMDFTKAAAGKLYLASKADRENYNALVLQTANIFSISARVLNK
jgi:hypothetical protein